MHTRDKITGTICKCMECARARQKRLKREALKRKPQTYRGTEDDLLQADSLRQEADKIANDAMKRRRELLESIRQQIIDEEN